MASRLLPTKPDRKEGDITLDTVHTLTLYELRQELTRRGEWDLKDQDITYKNALSKMVQILVKEKEVATERRAQELEKATCGGSDEELSKR